MSSSSVIVLVASLTLASALVVNRRPWDCSDSPGCTDKKIPWVSGIVDNGRFDLGVQLTKSLVELEFSYVVTVADYLFEPRLRNDFQQAFKDNQEKKHTADFLNQCRITASKIIKRGANVASVLANFKATCHLHPEGWPQQICQEAQKLFVAEASETQNFKSEALGTTVQAKDDYYAKQVCEDMQWHIMEHCKTNQKAQESPFVKSEDMEEGDEDTGNHENEREMEMEAETGRPSASVD